MLVHVGSHLIFVIVIIVAFQFGDRVRFVTHID